MSLAILLMSLLVFVALNVPICFSLGASSIIYLLIEKPLFLNMLPQRIWAGTNNFVMIAMPLFILAGELMNRGGITRRIINFSMLLVRPFRGGLGEVNVVASMIFGGISGSSVADTSALGAVLIPAMEKQGYSTGFSAGITVASSTMGMIIPPSIPMLIYALISGASVAQLFLAGLIPGLLIGIAQIIVVFSISRKRGYHPVYRKITPREVLHVTKDGLLAIIMPIVIVVSVSFGIATASESAGIAVLYALLLGFFVYRDLRIHDIIPILKKTVMTSSSVMVIIGFTMIFTWILAIEQVPGMIGNFIMGLNINRILILLLLDILILFIGTFVDVSPSLLLLCPILIPVMAHLGINELQLGAIMIVGTAIGLVTPPIGMCLNAATKICDLPITSIFWHAFPFLLCNVLILLLVTFVPEVSLWLPGLLIK